jgi:hypothetical protein
MATKRRKKLLRAGLRAMISKSFRLKKHKGVHNAREANPLSVYHFEADCPIDSGSSCIEISA